MKQLLFICLFGITFISCSESKKEVSKSETLPYYEEATFTPKWYSNPEDVPDTFHKIPKFSLINQQGNIVNETTVENKIFVVDFFFSSCPGICPKMTSNMYTIQESFLDANDVLLLSHSVTPEYDSVLVLKNYAEANKVRDQKWHLLTGNREEIYDLGRNQYFVEEDLGLTKDPDDFIHTENFILVDQNRHIRGIYNGLNKTDVNLLIKDIRLLQKSMGKIQPG